MEASLCKVLLSVANSPSLTLQGEKWSLVQAGEFGVSRTEKLLGLVQTRLRLHTLSRTTTMADAGCHHDWIWNQLRHHCG